jgi:hypothetical protein
MKIKFCECGPWDHIDNASFSSLLTNGPKKPVLQNTTLGWKKYSSLFGPFVGYGEKKFCENCPFDTLGALRQKQIPLAETIFFQKYFKFST